MKIYDIVFSPTGGTQKVSSLLTDALEGEVIHVDLTDSRQNFHTVSLTRMMWLSFPFRPMADASLQLP